MKKRPLKGRNEHRSRRFVAAFEAILERTERPISRVELAREIGADPSLISLLLSSSRHPTPVFVGRLCKSSQINSDEALALITAHLRDVADEALPRSGRLTVDKVQIALNVQTSAA